MMNDRRFKELANLYLDHRLDAAQASELEAELRADPRRRRQLRCYESMHAGCSELFRRSSSGAPAPAAVLRALRDADRRVEREPRRAVWGLGWGWASLGGAGMAAALVAVVTVRVSGPSVAENSASPADPASGLARASSGAAPAVVVVAAADPFASARAAEPVAVPAASYSLPRHVTLAAVGIATPTRETATTSRWTVAADETLTAEDLQRAEAWTRGIPQAEWAAAAGQGTALVRSGQAGFGGFEATAAGFSFQR